ncbi:hypothetical protein INS49_012440 [Diaporthe citri]|uniref:uncharacterized protein n=1 Tax=Diaporthe citri TaxID=83186 RepID=UPI001C8076EE|nr:uncharacterized protein INS49_012440 [Diaporthe citri]KAG6358920.1 hypothetical protein INS49_012440 [Diaporthe citri]
MKWLSAAALSLVAPVQAGLRFQCSTLTIQRLDPVVQPGAVPASHVHHIVGGNAFNATMEGDVGARATCTTCEMSEDFSNYWTAVLYFKHPTNGSYHRVPVIPVNPGNLDGYSGTKGGLTVYYSQTDLIRDDIAHQPVKTFPPHVGLRYQCWDGKNLDSPDHQSHMYNSITQDGFVNAGKCPSTHPVRMPQVAFETVWDTSKFNSMWPSGTPNPYVWSFEGTAAGTHADYMFGWKGDSLQRAMNKSECFYDGCGSITKQQMSVANQCTIKQTVQEETDGWLPKLPGM